MDAQFWSIHTLPLWFLVFSLFLPRLALLVYWAGDGHSLPFHANGLIPLIAAVVLPRVLVLYLIYQDQGVGFWFAIHLIAALVLFASGGRYQTRRRLDRQRAIG